MATAKKLIVGNWKMNLNVHEASLFLHRLEGTVKLHRNVEIVLAPSTLTLQSLSLQINHRKFRLAAQNVYFRDNGAYTGEVSASQVRGLASYVIVGHSERRHIFSETDTDIRAKVQAVVRNGMKPILCVGETALERSDGETLGILHDQVTGGLANVTSEELEQVVIAYEPVWAIGTGNSASPGDAAQAANLIRAQVASLFGTEASQRIRVLYGGSVTQDNARGYLNEAGIDGLLIGGASLDALKFNQIIEMAHTVGSQNKKENAHP